MILRHELYSDGTFVTTEFKSKRVTNQNGKLFMGYGEYDDKIELNTDKNKCVNGPYGVYFEEIKKHNKSLETDGQKNIRHSA